MKMVKAFFLVKRERCSKRRRRRRWTERSGKRDRRFKRTTGARIEATNARPCVVFVGVNVSSFFAVEDSMDSVSVLSSPLDFEGLKQSFGPLLLSCLVSVCVCKKRGMMWGRN